jgi:hypothetical protein
MLLSSMFMSCTPFKEDHVIIANRQGFSIILIIYILYLCV